MFLCQYKNSYLEIFSLNNEFNFIFYLHSVVCVGVQMYKRQKWREDIVVPYVTTYAVPLQCVHVHIQLLKQNNFINVNVIIYVEICKRHQYTFIQFLHKNIFHYFIPTSIIFFQQKIAGFIRRFFYFWILSYSGFCRKFFISVPFSNINGRVVSWLYSMSYFSMR